MIQIFIQSLFTLYKFLRFFKVNCFKLDIFSKESLKESNMFNFTIRQRLFCLLILLLVTLIQGQDTSPTLLKIGDKQNYTIPASSTKLFKFTIENAENDPNTNFYVAIRSDTKNFFKRPAVQIKSTENFTLSCYDADERFTDLCIIYNSEIQRHKQFQMNISCVLECTPEIHLYFQKGYKWKLNDQLRLNSIVDEPLTEQIILQVPEENFTSIEIIARMQDFQYAKQGIILRVNYGPATINVPTIYNYTLKAISLWDNAQGVIIPKQKLKPRDQIKILIVVPIGMQAVLRNSVVNGNKYRLNLNEQIGDVIAAQKNKLYQLKFQEKQLQELQNYTLNIKLVAYSGDPKMSISFTDQFLESQFSSSISVSGAINYPITAVQREKNGFKDQIYIEIKCNEDCSYEIAPEISQNNYIFLDLQSTQVQEIIGDQVINYIYEERVPIPEVLNQFKLSYTLKVQIIEGQMELALGRCKELQQTYNISKCIIKNATQMTEEKIKERFSEIDAKVKKTSNVYEISWTMDIKKCPVAQEILTAPGSKYHICEYHFVAYNKDIGKTKISESFYGLTLTSENDITWLRQGHIYRDTVLQGEYKYYAFEVTNVDQVQQIAFYLTIIQGKGLMAGSTQNRFPTTDSSMSSQRNSLVFPGDKKTTIYYVGVYGSQTTDFTIIATLRRTMNVLKSGITLQQNVLLNFTLPQNQSKALFYIHAYPQQSIKLEVYSMQGKISYFLRAQNDLANQSLCSSNPEQPCYFIASENRTKFLLMVTGSMSNVQVFTVLYGDTKDQKCIEHPMNHPIFLSLSAATQQCIEYILSEPKKIQLSLSVQSIKLLSNNLMVYANIGNNKLRVTERSLQLTPPMLFDFCNGKKGNINEKVRFSNCTLKISLKSDNKLDLGLILQDQNTEFTLFEGIQQRITDENVNVQQKFTKYFVSNAYVKWAGLNLLLMSHTQATYNISIKPIKEFDYNFQQRNIQQLFPNYEQALKSPGMIAQSSASKFIVINISPEIFSKQLQSQLLLITVQGKINGIQKQRSVNNKNLVFLSFDIQISRFEAQLPMGEAKVGYVEKNDIKTYTVPQGSYKSAEVSITSFYADSCAFLSKSQNNKQQTYPDFKNDFAILNNSGSSYTIHVIGKEDCSYQITVKDLSIPISQITSSMPVLIESNETKLFLYNHKSIQNFDIVQRLASGDSTIYIKSISYTQNLSKVLQQQPSRFAVNNEINKADLYLSNINASFCINCFYIIAVVPNPLVKQQLVIILDQQRIPLKQNYLVKLNLEAPIQEKLVYHSKTNFNIVLQVLNGNLSITIRNPLMISEINVKNVVKSQTILVQAPPQLPNQLKNRRLDEFDDTFRYEIDLTGQVDSLIAISIDKNNTLKTITTGIPMNVQINKQKVGVKFKTLQEDQLKNVIIRVQIVSMRILEQKDYEFLLEYDEIPNSPKNLIEKMPIQVNKVQNSFQIIASSGLVAQFYFYIIPTQKVQNETVSAVILLQGYKTTHLMSGSESIYSQNGTFEVFVSGELMMMEIFQCQGIVSVVGTSNLSNFNTNKPESSQMLALQHWNNGGHYVISTQLYNGLYFISVNSTDSSVKPQYLVRYHEYSGFSSNLYRQFDFKPAIKYTQDNETITFIVFPISPIKHSSMKLDVVKYTLIIGQNPQIIQKVSQCSQGRNQVLTYEISIDVANLNKQEEVVFKVKRKQIEDYLKLKNSKYLFVSTVAETTILQEYHTKRLPPALYFNYDQFQMSLGKTQTTVITGTDNSIFEILIFLVVPFLVGSILIFLSCRFFIRRVYSMYPMRLVEEDPVAQSQEGIHQNAQHEQIK